MNAVLRPEETFDWRQPDYAAIFRARAERLARIRQHRERLPALRLYYRDHIADFVSDWGCTIDPRNLSKGQPAFLPFVLMPKQRELVDWILERWQRNEPGIVEKSRDVGASWLAMAISVSLCLFRDGVAIGFGSAKEDKLDRSGDPDTLFAKGRSFIESLPVEFRNGFSDSDSLYMRLLFPATGSSITGEAGDNIGRGGRKSMFFIDEAAHLEHPELVDASLIANTDCRIDISSVNGMANSFARRRHSGDFPVFTLHYRHDLRKDEAWREQKRKTTDSVVWNAEYELNYTASVEGVIIPQEWVQAAIGSAEKLRIKPSGERKGALDVADQGRDVNAFAALHGIAVTNCESWSGQGSDLGATTERAFLRCDDWLLEAFDYDADGLGAGVRGFANRIRERRLGERLRAIKVAEFRGSAGVFQPDQKVPGTDRTALDMFQNLKAQAWWSLRRRFEATARAIAGADFDSDEIISLSPDIPNLQKLCIELSQPQWKLSATGKIMVDKVPDGEMSPNLADAVMMLFAPRARPMKIADSAFDDLDDQRMY